MQSFPQMVKQEAIIRLKVAALCISVDTLYVNNAAVEEEVAPFYAMVDKKYSVFGDADEVETRSSVAPHAFLYLNPTGSLSDFYETVLAALRQSIASGEMETVALRVDIETGAINAEETWIKTHDFAAWCVTRGLQIDDLSAKYEDDEQELIYHLDEIAFDKRREMEAPFFDADYSRKRASARRNGKGFPDDYDDALRTAMLLKMGFGVGSPVDHEVEERPLRTRERNALLSIIAVLCDEQGLNTERAAKTAAVIKHRADLAGIELGETTIENHLKKIPEAITRRLRAEPK